MQEPRNINALARELRLDYKTVDYNLRVLMKHRLVVAEEPRAYGARFFPSKNLLAARNDFADVCRRVVGEPAARPSSDELGKTT